MSTSLRLAVAGLLTAAVPTAMATALAAPAGAADSGTSFAAVATKVTAHLSDDAVASGEQLAVHGLLTKKKATSAGVTKAPLAGTVSVWSKTADGWERIKGASVHTDSDGHYRIRLILSATGQRTLKVVGKPDNDALLTDREQVTVTVS